MIWPHEEQELIKLVVKLNQIHPTVKVGAELPRKWVMFLDMRVTLEQAQLIMDLHVKTTNTHQHLHS